MGAIIVRNLPDEVHRALKLRANKAERSMEAEIRLILEEATRPQQRVRLGEVLTQMREKHGGVDFEGLRDKTPVDPIDLS